MDDSAVVLVMLGVTFVIGIIITLFAVAMFTYSRSTRREPGREVRDRSEAPPSQPAAAPKAASTKKAAEPQKQASEEAPAAAAEESKGKP